ncbi:hypothetical protein [Pseudoalteromonas sp. 2CM32C]|uniref:hypothetical protein n=1 Tax=Pseudoalteromonas sp. 2CM32C TaxID=2929852 RepID=UPI0020BF15CA|nr:hypothetical protein [Pseudoalteromonas sp. 2CM32C]MCK8120763.1 hypothetical protein [Pseudoalteromonas sp. 2CM32C]
MEDEKHNIRNEESRSLTYMPWHEHIKDFFLSQWKFLPIYWIAFFGIFWGLIEASSFFFPNSGLSNIYVLSSGILLAFIISFIRCVHAYRNSVPNGLENEPSIIHKIAFSKKHYWEYSLAYELVKSRIHGIDQKLEDVLSNRVHITVKRTMSVEQYADWLQTRPENLLRIVEVSKQLLIFDLIEAIHADEENEVDYHNLIRVVDLIKDAYGSAYRFEVEGREIKTPEDLEVIHEIQAGWASVIRDGFHQMLEILQSVAARRKGDFSPLDKIIVFEEPPRIDEFCDKLDKISCELEFEREI